MDKEILEYAYRRLPYDSELLDRSLNEALARGWELHMFYPPTTDTSPSAVFARMGSSRYRGKPYNIPVFKDESREPAY